MKTILRFLLFLDKWRKPLKTLDEWKEYYSRLDSLESNHLKGK